MARKPAPTKAHETKEPKPTPTKAIEPKPNRFSNPLLTEPEIHPDLKPLLDAVVMVSVWSSAIARCYSDLLALKESRGLPKPEEEWPDSPALERNRAQHAEWVKAERDAYAKRGESVVVADFREPRWTELMREWSGYYRDWCAAIATAKQAAKSPAVAAIMDAGESRPAHRWTTQAIIDLDNLAGTLHPIQTGGVDGLGFIRCGLPPLPTDFPARAEAVGKRIGELRSIPVARETRRERRMYWLAQAMLTVRDYPEWSDAEIARLVGVSKSTLSRAREYRRAARFARKPKTPAGSVTVANGDRELEAVDDSFDPNRRASRQRQDEEDTDDRIDREMKETQRNTQRAGAKAPVNHRSGGA